MNAPIPFRGLPDEAAANRASHRWAGDPYSEIRCYECDAKPWHVAANYPCGVEPPRTEGGQGHRQEVKPCTGS